MASGVCHRGGGFLTTLLFFAALQCPCAINVGAFDEVLLVQLPPGLEPHRETVNIIAAPPPTGAAQLNSQLNSSLFVAPQDIPTLLASSLFAPFRNESGFLTHNGSLYLGAIPNAASLALNITGLNNSDLLPLMNLNPYGLPLADVKKAIEDAVEAGMTKAKATAESSKDGKDFTEVMKESVEEEMLVGWKNLQKSLMANRFKRREWKNHPGGFVNFFTQVKCWDWILFLLCLFLFSLWHRQVIHWPSTRPFHGGALIIWFLMAGIYSFVIFERQGTTGGIMWVQGYILDLVFLVENVLVSHIIVSAFRTPRWVNEKALFVVVFARIFFQMILYMGLAKVAFSGRALPYVLGLWLLYLAVSSAVDDGGTNFEIMDTRVVHLARAFLGDRLSLTQDESGNVFTTKDGKTRLSLVGLMVCCLIFVDFLLHIDVALTKTAELQGNGFICFSSAAIASFCMPELVFVTRDFFLRFPGIKYGISGVLIYISFQMLLHRIWWPPVSMDLGIWIGMLVGSATLPVIFGGFRTKTTQSHNMGTQACVETPISPPAAPVMVSSGSGDGEISSTDKSSSTPMAAES